MVNTSIKFRVTKPGTDYFYSLGSSELELENLHDDYWTLYDITSLRTASIKDIEDMENRSKEFLKNNFFIEPLDTFDSGVPLIKLSHIPTTIRRLYEAGYLEIV